MLAAALAALTLAAQAQADAAEKVPRPRTVEGTVAEVSLAGGRITLGASEGPLTLSLDRNTLVQLETRLGTVLDLAPGQSVRASVGPRGEAHWIEILPTAQTPAPTATPSPGQSP